MAVLLLLSPSSSPASRICSNWLLSVYSVGCCVCFALWLRPWQIFRDEDFLLLIVVSSNPISWLLLDCIVFYCAPLKSTQIPIDCCVDRHVICASHASALPSGGDHLHCAIICSLVEGQAVVVPKMAAQLTAPTPPPVAKTFVRVFVAFGWSYGWRRPPCHGCFVEVVVCRVGELERWESKGEAS